MELDGHLARPLYLVDGVRYVGVLYVSLVGRVEENERIVAQGVVHPLAQLVFRQHGARGVVGVTEVDDVHASVGQLRHEAVAGRARHVHHVAPPAVVDHPRAPYHHVRVYVYGIDGVGHADAVVPPHQLLYVARVALCAVVDEYLRRVEVYAARQEVVLHYGLAQEGVALLGPIAVEPALGAHLVGSLVYGLDHRRAQRPRDVAYAQADDACRGGLHLEGVHLLGNVGEQVVVRQLEEMFVYQCHKSCLFL